jgi:hypothetical protein
MVLRRIQQCLSVLLSVSLMVTSAPFSEAAAPAELSIPARLGYITASSGKIKLSSNPQPLVILIQDLHAHYGVQKNIAKILDVLSTRLSLAGVGTADAETRRHGDTERKQDVSPRPPVPASPRLPFALAVEGASGPIDTSALALFPDAQIKLRAADYLMREAELTGTEYFAIQKSLPRLLVGVEDERYYALHRDLFRKTYADREQLVQWLQGLRSELVFLGEQTYSKEIKNFRRKLHAFENGKMGFDEAARWLADEAQPFGMDVSNLNLNQPEKLYDQVATIAFILQIQKAKSKQEKNLIQVEHDLELLQKVTNLQAVENQVRSFGPRLNQFVVLCHSLLTANGLKTFNQAKIRELISSSIDYYAMALMRNRPMVEKTLALTADAETRRHGDTEKDLLLPRVSASPRPRVAVLVAGGFHTEGLVQLLKARKVSYVVITPSVDQLSDADHELYVKRLRGEHLKLDEVRSAAQQAKGSSSPSRWAKIWSRPEGSTLAAGFYARRWVPALVFGFGISLSPEALAVQARAAYQGHPEALNALTEALQTPRQNLSPSELRRAAMAIFNRERIRSSWDIPMNNGRKISLWPSEVIEGIRANALVVAEDGKSLRFAPSKGPENIPAFEIKDDGQKRTVRVSVATLRAYQGWRARQNRNPVDASRLFNQVVQSAPTKIGDLFERDGGLYRVKYIDLAEDPGAPDKAFRFIYTVEPDPTTPNAPELPKGLHGLTPVKKEREQIPTRIGHETFPREWTVETVKTFMADLNEGRHFHGNFQDLAVLNQIFQNRFSVLRLNPESGLSEDPIYLDELISSPRVGETDQQQYVVYKYGQHYLVEYAPSSQGPDYIVTFKWSVPNSFNISMDVSKDDHRPEVKGHRAILEAAIFEAMKGILRRDDYRGREVRFRVRFAERQEEGRSIAETTRENPREPLVEISTTLLLTPLRDALQVVMAKELTNVLHGRAEERVTLTRALHSSFQIMGGAALEALQTLGIHASILIRVLEHVTKEAMGQPIPSGDDLAQVLVDNESILQRAVDLFLAGVDRHDPGFRFTRQGQEREQFPIGHPALQVAPTISRKEALKPNLAIKTGRVTEKQVHQPIKEAIQKKRAFKAWSRSSSSLQEGDEVIPARDKEARWVELARKNLNAEENRLLDGVDVVVIEGNDLLYFADGSNHQSIHVGRGRRTIFIGEGLWQRIRFDDLALAAALGHELFHIANYDRIMANDPAAIRDAAVEEAAAVAREQAIDAKQGLRKAIDKMVQDLASHVRGKPQSQVIRRSRAVTRYLATEIFGLSRLAAQEIIANTRVNVVRTNTQSHAGGIGMEIAVDNDIDSPDEVVFLLRKLAAENGHRVHQVLRDRALPENQQTVGSVAEAFDAMSRLAVASLISAERGQRTLVELQTSGEEGALFLTALKRIGKTPENFEGGESEDSRRLAGVLYAQIQLRNPGLSHDEIQVKVKSILHDLFYTTSGISVALSLPGTHLLGAWIIRQLMNDFQGDWRRVAHLMGQALTDPSVDFRTAEGFVRDVKALAQRENAQRRGGIARIMIRVSGWINGWGIRLAVRFARVFPIRVSNAVLDSRGGRAIWNVFESIARLVEGAVMPTRLREDLSGLARLAEFSDASYYKQISMREIDETILAERKARLDEFLKVSVAAVKERQPLFDVKQIDGPRVEFDLSSINQDYVLMLPFRERMMMRLWSLWSNFVHSSLFSLFFPFLLIYSGLPGVAVPPRADHRLVNHETVNRAIRNRLPEDLWEDPSRIVHYPQETYVGKASKGKSISARVIDIPGLFESTGQLAHIGLGRRYGVPVIYIDSSLRGADRQLVLDHEMYEIAKWEIFRALKGLQPVHMRSWILEHIGEARQLAAQWHKEAQSIDHLLDKMALSHHVLLSPAFFEEDNDINLAAGAENNKAHRDGAALSLDGGDEIFKHNKDKLLEIRRKLVIPAKQKQIVTEYYGYVDAQGRILYVVASKSPLSPRALGIQSSAFPFHIRVSEPNFDLLRGIESPAVSYSATLDFQSQEASVPQAARNQLNKFKSMASWATQGLAESDAAIDAHNFDMLRRAWMESGVYDIAGKVGTGFSAYVDSFGKILYAGEGQTPNNVMELARKGQAFPVEVSITERRDLVVKGERKPLEVVLNLEESTPAQARQRLQRFVSPEAWVEAAAAPQAPGLSGKGEEEATEEFFGEQEFVIGSQGVLSWSVVEDNQLRIQFVAAEGVNPIPRHYRLVEGQDIVVGIAPSADFYIAPSPLTQGISKTHLAFRLMNGKLQLQDRSSNGTWSIKSRPAKAGEKRIPFTRLPKGKWATLASLQLSESAEPKFEATSLDVFAGSTPRLLSKEQAMAQVIAYNKELRYATYKDKGVVDFSNLSENVEIIVVGDIHTRLDNLKKILNDNDNYQKIRDGRAVLLLLGDLIHNEPPPIGKRLLWETESSVEIMQFVMSLTIRHPKSVYLLASDHHYLNNEVYRGRVPQSEAYREKLRELYGDDYLEEYRLAMEAAPREAKGRNGKTFAAGHAGPARGKSWDEIKNTAAVDTIIKNQGSIIRDVTYSRHQSVKQYTEDPPNEKDLYSDQDISDHLEEIGVPGGVFIVSHTPLLLQEGDRNRQDTFHKQISPNLHLIYSAFERTGYLVLRSNSSEVTAVDATDSSAEFPNFLPPLSGEDYLYGEAPEEGEERLEALRRFVQKNGIDVETWATMQAAGMTASDEKALVERVNQLGLGRDRTADLNLEKAKRQEGQLPNIILANMPKDVPLQGRKSSVGALIISTKQGLKIVFPKDRVISENPDDLLFGDLFEEVAEMEYLNSRKFKYARDAHKQAVEDRKEAVRNGKIKGALHGPTPAPPAAVQQTGSTLKMKLADGSLIRVTPMEKGLQIEHKGNPVWLPFRDKPYKAARHDPNKNQSDIAIRLNVKHQVSREGTLQFRYKNGVWEVMDKAPLQYRTARVDGTVISDQWEPLFPAAAQAPQAPAPAPAPVAPEPAVKAPASPQEAPYIDSNPTRFMQAVSAKDMYGYQEGLGFIEIHLARGNKILRIESRETISKRDPAFAAGLPSGYDFFVTDPGSPTKVLPLGKGKPEILGRKHGPFAMSGSVSSSHVSIEYHSDGVFTIKDLKSTNGTEVKMTLASWRKSIPSSRPNAVPERQQGAVGKLVSGLRGEKQPSETDMLSREDAEKIIQGDRAKPPQKQAMSVFGQMGGGLKAFVGLQWGAAFREWLRGADILFNSRPKSIGYYMRYMDTVSAMQLLGNQFMQQYVEEAREEAVKAGGKPEDVPDVEVVAGVLDNPRWGQAMEIIPDYDDAKRLIKVTILINPSISLSTLRHGFIHEMFHAVEPKTRGIFVHVSEELRVIRRSDQFMVEHHKLIENAVQASQEAVQRNKKEAQPLSLPSFMIQNLVKQFKLTRDQDADFHRQRSILTAA